MFGAKHRFSQARRTTGPKYFLHFSCFRKLHFSSFASSSGPKTPPERDSWRPESPIVSASETPFGAPKNAEQEGISFLQNTTSEAGRDFRSFLRVCVCLGVAFGSLQRR